MNKALVLVRFVVVLATALTGAMVVAATSEYIEPAYIGLTTIVAAIFFDRLIKHTALKRGG
jgi:hypothetical protein